MARNEKKNKLPHFGALILGHRSHISGNRRRGSNGRAEAFLSKWDGILKDFMAHYRKLE